MFLIIWELLRSGGRQLLRLSLFSSWLPSSCCQECWHAFLSPPFFFPHCFSFCLSPPPHHHHHVSHSHHCHTPQTKVFITKPWGESHKKTNWQCYLVGCPPAQLISPVYGPVTPVWLSDRRTNQGTVATSWGLLMKSPAGETQQAKVP